jgi:hypothetical protein
MEMLQKNDAKHACDHQERNGMVVCKGTSVNMKMISSMTLLLSSSTEAIFIVPAVI